MYFLQVGTRRKVGNGNKALSLRNSVQGLRKLRTSEVPASLGYLLFVSRGEDDSPVSKSDRQCDLYADSLLVREI